MDRHEVMYTILSAQAMFMAGEHQARFVGEAFELKCMEVGRLVETYGFEHPQTRRSTAGLKTAAEGEEGREETVRGLLGRYGGLE